jgi:hypothetical protein
MDPEDIQVKENIIVAKAEYVASDWSEVCSVGCGKGLKSILKELK